jgi:His/Glu/Gln/Arg/opine family amino acid ABC transporter permease subunit
MTTIPDSRSLSGPITSHEEPPPLLVVGPLAWVRKNLFSSWVDTLLTVITSILVGGALSSFFLWAIGQANWFVVILNLRLLILGRFPVDAEWRVALLAAISAFAIGMSLAAWTRVPRNVAVILALVLLILFVAPPLITAFIPVSPSYVAAGNGEIAFGASKETPQAHVGFIARAGETITIRFADQYATNDSALSSVHSFSDKAAANAAASRLDTAAQIESFRAQLASDLLTGGQRARLNTQLAKLQVPPPITETFMVNRGAIKVRLLRGATLDALVAGTLKTGSDTLRVTLPADGWYILEKIPADSNDKGAALLEVQGIGPLLEREFTGATTIGRSSQYVRVADNFSTLEIRPAPDGKNVPMATIVDNAYRGNHTITDFLRLFVGPFFDALKFPLLILIAAAVLGYLGAGLLDRLAPPVVRRRKLSRRVTTWLLIALPIIMFGLVYGVGNILPLTDTRRWGGLLLTIMLTVVSIIASFPLGVALALGRRSALPIVSIASTVYIEFVRGVPLITVLFMAQLLLPLVNPALAEMPNAFRAMVAITLFTAAYLAENVRGGLQAVPHGQQEAAKALGLNSLQITFDITLPQALRVIFPALVGLAISLFIDTSLVTIVGLLDLTGMAQNIVTQTEFIGQRRETLLFITLVYFGISYAISSVSRRIERTGAGSVQIRNI